MREVGHDVVGRSPSVDVVRELSVSYDGGPWMLDIDVLECRGDRIARERIDSSIPSAVFLGAVIIDRRESVSSFAERPL